MNRQDAKNAKGNRVANTDRNQVLYRAHSAFQMNLPVLSM